MLALVFISGRILSAEVSRGKFDPAILMNGSCEKPLIMDEKKRLRSDVYFDTFANHLRQ